MKYCLIVDDSEIVRKILRRTIEDMGYTCTEAGDGEEAYNACRALMPDVIVTDWNMPVLNGLDFIKKLRRTAGGDKVKVIFCSAESNLKKIRQAVDAGADEYVMKPFDNTIIYSKFYLLGLYKAM